MTVSVRIKVWGVRRVRVRGGLGVRIRVRVRLGLRVRVRVRVRLEEGGDGSRITTQDNKGLGLGWRRESQLSCNHTRQECL